MDNLRLCPFCGEQFIIFNRGEGEWLRYFVEHNRSCLMYYHFENVVGYTDVDLLTKELNTRPLEDDLLNKLHNAEERYISLQKKIVDLSEQVDKLRAIQSGQFHELQRKGEQLDVAIKLCDAMNNYYASPIGDYQIAFDEVMNMMYHARAEIAKLEKGEKNG